MDGPAFRRGGRILFSVPFPVSGNSYQSVVGWSQINFNKIEKQRLHVAEVDFHSSWLQRKNCRRPSGTWTGFTPWKVVCPAPLETWDALVAFQAEINSYTEQRSTDRKDSIH